ncbi:MAG: hypothetical protein L6Q78_11025 [Bacteroidia bacterium]|nr:hypothetical protein [Bacteroidia bacterium]
MLEKWLQNPNRNYKKGIEILEKLQGRSAIIGILEKSDSAFNRKLLFDQLSKLHHSKNEKQPEKQPEKKQEPIKKNWDPAAPILPKPETQSLFDLKLAAFKKLSALHNQLCNIEGNSPKAIQERYKIQLEILKLDALNEECWDKIHYFEEHGKLPEEKDKFDFDGKTIRELINLEKAIPSYVTKINNQLKDTELNPERLIELTRQKADWILCLEKIKEELSALPTLSKIKEVLC